MVRIMNICERDLEKDECNIDTIKFCWKDNPSVQKLLDVVVSIMAEEYIEVAKKNSEIFKERKHSDS